MNTPVSLVALLLAVALAYALGQVAPQPSDLPEKAERVGLSAAAPAGGADWFLSPATAPANQAFSLRLLSENYGNCQTTFGHARLDQAGNVLTAAFTIQTDTSVVCIVDIRPHGPAFQAGPLPAGKYPVRVMETPACVYDPQPCPWLPGDQTARTVDTLAVGAAVPVRPSREGQARGAVGPAPRTGLRRQGGTLAVTLPGALGARAESGLPGSGDADLRGRRLDHAVPPPAPPASATE